MRPESVQLLEVLVLEHGRVGRIAAVIARLEGVAFDEGRVATPVPPPSSRVLSESPDAVRMRARRAERKANVQANATEQNPNAFANDPNAFVRVRSSSRALPLSADSEKLSEYEGYSSSGNAREGLNDPNERTNAFANVRSCVRRSRSPDPDASGVVTIAPDLNLIDPSVKLSPEGRAAAEMAGMKPDDVDGAWIAFVGHMVSKGIRSADFERGEWPKWFSRAREYAKRDQGRGGGAPLVQPTGAGGKRLWKVGGGGE